MARVTRVKKAQQRYKTVPVIDPETGEPKKTPVMKKVKDYETGEVTEVQKTTKTGRPVFMSVTRADKTQPLPELRCDFPGCDINGGKIAVGTAYKHITPKSGPYGGTQKNRHDEHPTWNVWEYSSSLSARTAEIAYNFDKALESATDTDEVQAALDEAAESVREIAEEKRESASNIEEGFGHPTSASEELEQTAEDLDGWADEIEAADIPDLPDPEDAECEECEGTGTVTEDEGDEEKDCEECDGSGHPSEVTEDQFAEWRDEVRDTCSIIDECPV